MVDLFMAERFDVMAAFAQYPFVLHVEEAFVTLTSPAAMIAVSKMYRDALGDRGITRVLPRVSAVELPRQRRARAWIDFEHYAGDELVDAPTTTILYSSVAAPHQLLAEMMHFTRCGLPEWKDQLPKTSVLG